MPKQKAISIPIRMDLQSAYDSAVAQARAWTAYAEALRDTGSVCVHPTGARLTGPGRNEFCRLCGCRMGPDQDDLAQAEPIVPPAA